MQRNGASSLGKLPVKQEQYSEYKLRVPKNLVKKYNVMKLNSPRPVKLGEVKEANMVRKTKKQVFIEEEGTNMPTYGAGSVYNYERKEEARRKRRGYVKKVISQDDLPYALRLGGKGGKRYTGRKEPILEHSAYYVLTQCPDGVFEAVPVQAWYSFMPDIEYSTLTSDEVEQEFSKRDRTLSYFTKKYQIGNATDEEVEKVRRKDDDHGLIIHDDEIDEEDQEEENAEQEENSDSEKKKKKHVKKEKNIFRGKGKKGEEDSDEEEELENFESKEVDYMSESSSEDELIEMDDEPDPEKEKSGKAKDDLNIFSDSEDEDEEEGDLNEAGKQLKSMLKKESGEGGSSDEEEEEEDEDIDKEFSKSAVFMQDKDGKKRKGKSGSNSGSKPGSRSSTPVQAESSADTLSQAAKSLKEAGSKRSMERSSPSPQSKKQKLGSIVTANRNSPLTLGDSSKSSSRSGTPSDGGNAITEVAIRRYLSHKPMTTTDLMRKFKFKKTGLSKEQTVNAIGTILNKIHPNQEKIDGKLYLSIKTKK